LTLVSITVWHTPAHLFDCPHFEQNLKSRQCKNWGGCIENAPNPGCKYFPKEIFDKPLVKHLMTNVFTDTYGVCCWLAWKR
jgi:hypothetical protein